LGAIPTSVDVAAEYTLMSARAHLKGTRLIEPFSQRCATSPLRLAARNEGMSSMFKHYPALGVFDEFYAFEAVARLYKLPPPYKLHRLLAPYMSAERMRTFPERHFFFQTFIGAFSEPDTVPPTIGLSSLLRIMLQLQPADFVVVKMDVEGYEYDIVPTLLADGTASLIDEIMLEVHYNHPKMRQMFNWCRKPQFWCNHTLQDAVAIYHALRRAGVYAHHWP